MISPIRGMLDAKVKEEGVFFPKLNYTFTSDLIIAKPKFMKFETSTGNHFEMRITKNEKEFPVLQFDKVKVQKQLATSALEAGATIKYNTRVNDLIIKNGKVGGAIINGEEVKSKIVLSAEGLSRKFTKKAGLYKEDPKDYFNIAGYHLDGYAFPEEFLGQYSFFGTRFINKEFCSAVLHTIGYNKALIIISFLLKEKEWPHEKTISEYLELHLENIAFLKEMVKKASQKKPTSCRIIYQKPSKLVCDGFVGIGDSVAPLGHSSNAIALLMGKEAVNLIKDALLRKNFSEKFLSRFNQWLRSKLFKGVEFEAKLISTLMSYKDEELEKVCNAFKGINLEPFFIRTPMEIMTASMKLSLKPKILKNWSIIKRMF